MLLAMSTAKLMIFFHKSVKSLQKFRVKQLKISLRVSVKRSMAQGEGPGDELLARRGRYNDERCDENARSSYSLSGRKLRAGPSQGGIGGIEIPHERQSEIDAGR